MREIKFRGISLLTGEFVFGSYVKTNYSQTGAIIIGLTGLGNTEVKPETVAQYIGMIDKNGVEIYERDTVKAIPLNAHDFTPWIGVVEFNELKMAYLCDGEPLGAYESFELEVIRNIHQTPELLGDE